MLQKFLEYIRYELNRAPLTIEAYERDIKQFQEWLNPNNAEEPDYPSITSSDVRAWLSSLAKKGETSRTLRRKTVSLRSFFKWMVKSGVIKSSPLRDVPLPKLSKPLPDLIKSEEIEGSINKLKEQATEQGDSPMAALIVEMFYSLGIRRAELMGLNDEDISYSKAEIKVTGKRSKQRIIPVPEKLLSQIRAWQEYRDKELDKCKDGTTPLFIMNGKRINAKYIYLTVTRALQDSTARKKSPHALRHSFASGMLNGGANINSVKEFLGHSSLATTQIYTHISLNEIKRAYSSAHPRSVENKK